MADVKPIISVSVKSLDITDPGLKQRLEQIAKSGGGQNDLDTPEEFRAAAELLEQAIKQAKKNLFKTESALCWVQIRAGRAQTGTSVRLMEEGIPYEYTFKNFPIKKTFLGREYVDISAYLERRNLLTNETQIIKQAVYHCAHAEKHIAQLATDGTHVYVTFEGSPNYFGKVVNKVIEGNRVYPEIQFAKIETDWKVGVFVVQGGKLFMDTVNATLESPSHSLVSAAVLPFKEFHERTEMCGPL